jgi:hypothetical protein
MLLAQLSLVAFFFLFGKEMERIHILRNAKFRYTASRKIKVRTMSFQEIADRLTVEFPETLWNKEKVRLIYNENENLLSGKLDSEIKLLESIYTLAFYILSSKQQGKTKSQIEETLGFSIPNIVQDVLIYELLLEVHLKGQASEISRFIQVCLLAEDEPEAVLRKINKKFNVRIDELPTGNGIDFSFFLQNNKIKNVFTEK